MRILALDELHLCLKIALRYIYAEIVIRVMDTLWRWKSQLILLYFFKSDHTIFLKGGLVGLSSSRGLPPYISSDAWKVSLSIAKGLKLPQPMNNLPFQMALILLYNRWLSDKDWCEQHSLPTSTFYTEIYRLRKKACDIPKAENQLLKVETIYVGGIDLPGIP